MNVSLSNHDVTISNPAFLKPKSKPPAPEKRDKILGFLFFIIRKYIKYNLNECKIHLIGINKNFSFIAPKYSFWFWYFSL